MTRLKSWIRAARPRTLALAISGVLMGGGLALFYGGFNASVCLLALITVMLIQIFANFANEYGDFHKGTDNPNRVGPWYTLQSGEITPSQMKQAMVIIVLLSLFFGIWLIISGTGSVMNRYFPLFFALGTVSLLAAYFYAAGKKSYGYIGLGDLAVFLFFGLIAVMGTYFLSTRHLFAPVILPAITIGCFSTGVLNLNNMRDEENDRRSGKITLSVRLGPKRSRQYHLILLSTGWMAAVLFTIMEYRSALQFIHLLILPVFGGDIVYIFRTHEPGALDPFLPKLALSTLSFTILFCLGLILTFI